MKRSGPMRVHQMDLLCTVPYYAAELCLALRRQGADARFGLTTYYQDREHFRKHGLATDPGLLDVVAHLPSRPPVMRRVLKTVEACVNVCALAVRFAVRPPDVVHVQFLALLLHGMPFELWLLGWARRRGSRLVYTVHDRLPHDSGERFREKYRRLYGWFDALVCHNAEAKRGLIEDFGVGEERIWVIPHGPLFADLPEVDRGEAARRLGVEDARGVVLWQGIVRPYKGVDFLLEAWAGVTRGRRGALLMVSGIAPQETEEELRRKAVELGLGESVRFEFRYLTEEEMAVRYAAADVVVYPYREITTSGALMTGLARHKAIVATRMPAFEEILEDGKSARLVDYGDREGLWRVLVELLENPAERDRLEAGASAVERELLNWDRIAEKTIEGYHRLLAERDQYKSVS